ncbi:hypothetical protein DNK01_18570 [Stutzerimonas kirkiae]|nr:hypothetical protein DNK01_18570 [Stutzerimonas kirkiae]
MHTTDMPIAANVLDRQFNPSQPDQAWVADITYIRTEHGWLYLAAVLDLYSRKIVGWAMGAEHACRAGLYGLADGHRLTPAQVWA